MIRYDMDGQPAVLTNALLGLGWLSSFGLGWLLSLAIGWLSSFGLGWLLPLAIGWLVAFVAWRIGA